MSPDLHGSRGYWGKKRGRSVDGTRLGGSLGLELLQLLIIGPNNEVSWPEDTEWPVIPSMVGFFPGDTGIFHDGDARIHPAQIATERFRAWDLIFTHGSVTTESRSEPQWESLGRAAEALRSVQTLPSSIQDIGEKRTQHWMEINHLALQANISVHCQVLPVNNRITCDWSCYLSPVSGMRRRAPALVFAPNLCWVWKKGKTVLQCVN